MKINNNLFKIFFLVVVGMPIMSCSNNNTKIVVENCNEEKDFTEEKNLFSSIKEDDPLVEKVMEFFHSPTISQKAKNRGFILCCKFGLYEHVCIPLLEENLITSPRVLGIALFELCRRSNEGVDIKNFLERIKFELQQLSKWEEKKVFRKEDLRTRDWLSRACKEAALHKDCGVVKIFLEEDLVAQKHMGEIFWTAVNHGWQDIFNILVNKVDVKVKNRAFILAAERGRLEMGKVLWITSSFDNKWNKRALFKAICSTKNEFTKWLLDSFVFEQDTIREALDMALSFRNNEAVRFLLDKLIINEEDGKREQIYFSQLLFNVTVHKLDVDIVEWVSDKIKSLEYNGGQIIVMELDTHS